MSTRRRYSGLIRMGLLLLATALVGSRAQAKTKFVVSFPAQAKERSITGRLIVFAALPSVASDQVKRNPLEAVGPNGPAGFGVDVENMTRGDVVVVNRQADGFPTGLDELPAGDYDVQAVLIPYKFARRADGHNIWVPMSYDWAIAPMFPGNYFSKTMRIKISGAEQEIKISLTEKIAPITPQQDTPWIKRVRIKSKIMSDFWGIPIYIGASVLLPRDFNVDKNKRYPAVYTYGHTARPFGFSTDPASDTESARKAAQRAGLKTGYQFALEWQQDDFPTIVAITPETLGPYFLESYAVNSANNGPWGDAITRELMPYLEKKFRLIDEPYGRILEGASTGGWEALSLQLHYPDLFGGAWVFNPDPIDFSRYQLTNIYKENNMFSFEVGDWLTREKPYRRDPEGRPNLDVRTLATLEAMLGSKGRSYYQLDIWQTTFGPVGPDGYPVLLYDKKDGEINREVATYMRTHGYDLSAHLRDNWHSLSPKLRGKLNIFVGDMDDFFQNLAVYQFQEMVIEMGGKDYPARFEYGAPRQGHVWHHTDWAGVVREIAQHVEKNSPDDLVPAQRR